MWDERRPRVSDQIALHLSTSTDRPAPVMDENRLLRPSRAQLLIDTLIFVPANADLPPKTLLTNGRTNNTQDSTYIVTKVEIKADYKYLFK